MTRFTNIIAVFIVHAAVLGISAHYLLGPGVPKAVACGHGGSCDDFVSSTDTFSTNTFISESGESFEGQY